MQATSSQQDPLKARIAPPLPPAAACYRWPGTRRRSTFGPMREFCRETVVASREKNDIGHTSVMHLVRGNRQLERNPDAPQAPGSLSGEPTQRCRDVICRRRRSCVRADAAREIVLVDQGADVIMVGSSWIGADHTRAASRHGQNLSRLVSATTATRTRSCVASGTATASRPRCTSPRAPMSSFGTCVRAWRSARVGDTTVVRAYVLSLVYVSAPGFGFTGHVPAIPSATR